jgi:hypothetical protein
MKPALIAPCGMNCSLCVAYLRDKNKCPGCRLQGKAVDSNYCRKCIIKNCEILNKKNWKHCSMKCDKYPCRRLKKLDKRYRAKYGMSMLENLDFINEHGIREFIRCEKAKWIKGNKILCVHNRKYYDV